MGVALFYKESRHFAVEVHQLQILNVVSFQMETRGFFWKFWGCYLVPHKNSTLERVVEAIGQPPRGVNILVHGYYNVDM